MSKTTRKLDSYLRRLKNDQGMPLCLPSYINRQSPHVAKSQRPKLPGPKNTPYRTEPTLSITEYQVAILKEHVFNLTAKVNLDDPSSIASLNQAIKAYRLAKKALR